MLFMQIITWAPGRRDEFIKFEADALSATPSEGRKVHNLWFDLHGNRAFQLIELDNPNDPAIEFDIYHDVTDIISVERVTVAEFNDILKLTQKA